MKDADTIVVNSIKREIMVRNGHNAYHPAEADNTSATVCGIRIAGLDLSIVSRESGKRPPTEGKLDWGGKHRYRPPRAGGSSRATLVSLATRLNKLLGAEISGDLYVRDS